MILHPKAGRCGKPPAFVFARCYHGGAGPARTQGAPMRDVRRRHFITLLGGAVALWPLAARAQQPAMQVIGFLSTTSAGPFALSHRRFPSGLARSRLSRWPQRCH